MGVECAPYPCVHDRGTSEATRRSRLGREVHQVGISELVSFRDRLSRAAWRHPTVDPEARKVWRYRLRSHHGRCGLYAPYERRRVAGLAACNRPSAPRNSGLAQETK